jgi:hypothetical protein
VHDLATRASAHAASRLKSEPALLPEQGAIRARAYEWTREHHRDGAALEPGRADRPLDQEGAVAKARCAPIGSATRRLTRQRREHARAWIMSCDPDHSLQDPGVPRSITEVKRDLDRRGTAMIRDIVIMLAVVAAIVAFAPKVSGGANNPVARAADTACCSMFKAAR